MTHQDTQYEQFEAETMERYARDEIGLGLVAEILGIHIMDAQALLGKYDIDLAYDEEMLEQDMRRARAWQPPS